MKTHVIIGAISLITLFGCKSPMDYGELATRDDRYCSVCEKGMRSYLKNNSKSHIIKFTIKKYSVSKYSGDKEERTEIIKLNPGEEKDLGCQTGCTREGGKLAYTYSYKVVVSIESKE